MLKQTLLKPPVTIKQVSSYNSIPYQTFSDWVNKKNLDDWRPLVANELMAYYAMEDIVTREIYIIFSDKEILFIKKSLLDQVITWDFIVNEKYIVNTIINYGMTIQEKDFINNLLTKLSKLTLFHRYCLFKSL